MSSHYESLGNSNHLQSRKVKGMRSSLMKKVLKSSFKQKMKNGGLDVPVRKRLKPRSTKMILNMVSTIQSRQHGGGRGLYEERGEEFLNRNLARKDELRFPIFK